MTTRYPFTAYPNGWFLVAHSEELPAGGVLSLHLFGQELVLFRAESGTPKMLDAHCPHLGAHMGHGGCVKGEDIQCPFHGWRFNGKGECTTIPYAQKIPKQARTTAWHVRELHGVVMAWYHSEQLAPTYEPIVPVLNDGSWSTGRWHKFPKVRTHVQEIIENAADTAHFRYIHLAPTDTTCQLSFHEDGRVLRSELHSMLDILGTGELDKLLPSVTESLALTMGLSLSTTVAGPGRIRILVTHTPIDEEYVDVRFRLQVNKLDSPEMTEGFEAQTLGGVIANISRDINIWEHKVYRNPPVLCDGDGPIGPMRRWAKQFYTSTGAEQVTGTAQPVKDEQAA